MAKKYSAHSGDLKTPFCRTSYARDLFKARENKNGRAKFGCTLIFPKAERKFFEPIFTKLITEEWPKDGLERAKKGLIKMPLLAGDGKEAYNKTTGQLNAGLGPDVFFMRPTANEDRPPRVWFRDPNRQETEEVVYSGVWGKAILHFYTWNNEESGDMICAGISGFQRIPHPQFGEGERIGGSGPLDVDKWNETIADEGPVPETAKSGAGASGLFGD